MTDYHQRIKERQDVFDAYERGEIDREEYDRRLVALPKVRAPRDEPDWAGVKSRALNVVNRSLDIIERTLKGKS